MDETVFMCVYAFAWVCFMDVLIKDYKYEHEASYSEELSNREQWGSQGLFPHLAQTKELLD